MYARFRRLAGPAAASVLLATALAGAPSTAVADPAQLYVATDRSVLLDAAKEPFSKVSVANPAVADIQVITPQQVMVTGKAPGTTSLVLFAKKGPARYIDVIVHPGPVRSDAVLPASPQAHTVLVHRGEQVTERLFVRDAGNQWIELGSVKAEPEGGKK